ncbi:MAG TPA: hypothetical protein VM120_14895 [Bryobacteraceae bacterium]|nr:hypothetical protein [Bryobacteraceae bacterium]
MLYLIVEKYGHVTDLAELVPLSLKIARFKIMAGIRTVVRRGENTAVPVDELPLADARLNPAQEAERNQTTDRLKAALATLGERCRDLMRYKLQGKPFPEIQRIFKLASINTVYTWDFRCRKQLIEAMGGSWEGKK